MQQWKLREEVYRSFHQWMYLVLFALLGAAAGLGISYLSKAPYEAVSQLYVGLEAYRAYADPQFSAEANQEYTNQDDYKNWQMAQLDELVTSGEILDETLADLSQKHASWQGVTKQALREMLRAEWRTAGKWNIIARHEDSKRATEASQAWAGAIVKRTNQYIDASRKMMFIDLHMQQAAQDVATAEKRLASLKQAFQMVKDYEKQLQGMAGDQPVHGLMRSQVFSLAGVLADYSPGWQTLLAEQPTLNDHASAYLDYLAQMTPLITNEEKLVQTQYTQRMEAYDRLSLDYVRAVKESHGLSANLEVQMLDTDLAPVVANVRPSAFFVLCGSLLAICAWMLLQIVRISRRIERHE
jgi:hypothetical protein